MQISLSVLEVIARIAALPDEEVSLEVAVQSAIDSRGYFSGCIQDVLLQVYGDAEMAWSREVHRRADAFRQLDQTASQIQSRHQE